MRGKVAFIFTNRITYRITPAYAGKSITGLTRMLQQQDHPRLCGEKSMGIAQLIVYLGITPAYAGKSKYFIAK